MLRTLMNRIFRLIRSRSSNSDPDYTRACGLCVCQCGDLYYDHPYAGPDGYDGRKFLKRLCDGRFVKL